ncbi:MAG TPA: VWA domain-containing protein [Cyclobacteriaceae bacterium]
MAGEPFLYSITVQGDGNTFPIEPPRLSSMHVEANLIDITYTDTLIDDNFYSTKSFIYSMVFNKEGTYQLDKNVVFAYFNPTSNKLVKLQSKKNIVVESSVEKNTLPKSGLYNVYPKMILLDASESMLMEDYQPNRLEVIKHGVRDFLTKRKSCDIGLIAFTGEAKLKQINKPDSCYAYSLFKDISFNYFPKIGTAIGDAMWLGCHALKKTPNPILVVIGDGENNAGICPLSLAINHAKKYGIKVYTIGVGTKGLVPLGHDAQGRPMIYTNTFVDKDLKQISLQTGGKYFWAKDVAAITSILKIIFPE